MGRMHFPFNHNRNPFNQSRDKKLKPVSSILCVENEKTKLKVTFFPCSLFSHFPLKSYQKEVSRQDFIPELE